MADETLAQKITQILRGRKASAYRDSPHQRATEIFEEVKRQDPEVYAEMLAYCRDRTTRYVQKQEPPQHNTALDTTYRRVKRGRATICLVENSQVVKRISGYRK